MKKRLNGRLNIKEWDWKLKKQDKAYKGKKWHKGRYQQKGDTLLFLMPFGTSFLVKSKYKYALDHIVNSHGLKIDLPYARSIRIPDFAGDLRMKIYIGFDSLGKEKTIVDDLEIKSKESFTSIIKHYKDSALSYQRIHAILFCDKNASIDKLKFIEEELHNNDIQSMLYVTKYDELKPYDVYIRGIWLAIIRNDISVVPD